MAIAASALFFVVAIALGVSFGAEPIALSHLFDVDSLERAALLEARLPRVVLGNGVCEHFIRRVKIQAKVRLNADMRTDLHRRDKIRECRRLKFILQIARYLRGIDGSANAESDLLRIGRRLGKGACG
jgi:hypothetical protein